MEEIDRFDLNVGLEGDSEGLMTMMGVKQSEGMRPSSAGIVLLSGGGLSRVTTGGTRWSSAACAGVDDGRGRYDRTVRRDRW